MASASDVEVDRARLAAVGQQHPHRPLVRSPQRLEHPVHHTQPLPDEHTSGPAPLAGRGLQAAAPAAPAYGDSLK
ncbi:hypothetical protein [Streptomyces sp. IMTB 1903]|uniref:hypothetical protein n=1 Tax=Streptomyces sp. IMTB 1903 TaxID=1776680 RepID=UPI0007526957|nr:hypothetical protein [Streptomyces sp. IMTB 1903]